MLEQVQGVLVEALLSIVLAAIALGAAYATFYIKRASEKLRLETQKLEDEGQRKLVNNALGRLEEVAELTVNKLEEKTAKVLRESVKAGQVDKKELERLSVDAYHEIRKVLEPEYLELIENSLGDAQTYILNVIEDRLTDIKSRNQVFTLGVPE